MFDSLSDKLQSVFKNLRGYGKLTESNAADALREVRVALLEADVNYKVAKDFIERTKQKALGQEVLTSVQPGQQIIKIIHDELVTLLGAENAALNLSASPTNILLCGLHGATHRARVDGVDALPLEVVGQQFGLPQAVGRQFGVGDTIHVLPADW